MIKACFTLVVFILWSFQSMAGNIRIDRNCFEDLFGLQRVEILIEYKFTFGHCPFSKRFLDRHISISKPLREAKSYRSGHRRIFFASADIFR